MTFFEDIVVGESIVVGRHTFTAESIKAFARRFDPQCFHLDEDAAGRSQFGALCASGWQTAIVWMRLMVEHRRAQAEAARARGAKRLEGWYLPTKKNTPARDFYAAHGFHLREEKEGGQLWSLDLTTAELRYPEWVRLITHQTETA